MSDIKKVNFYELNIVDKIETYFQTSVGRKWFKDNFIEINPAGYKFTYLEGKFHSLDDNPSFVKYSQTGDILENQWHFYGALHRDHDKPAIYQFDPKTKKITAKYFTYGNLYKELSYYEKK